MDIHHLRIFVSVYRNRSFSRASEELDLSQPTVSEHLKNLETELGCRLFDRLGRTILPTPQGDILYTHALDLIERMDRVMEEISRAEGGISGQLVIGASTIPGTYLLPVLASEFKKKNPGVSFQILIEDSARIAAMVLGHELLLGVVGAMIDREEFRYFPFTEDELILAAADGLVPGESIGIEEIKKIPFILREEGSGTRATMERLLSEKGIGRGDLNVVAILGSTDSVKQAMKAGLGVSILSRVAVRDELASGALREIRVGGLSMHRMFHLITHRKRTLPHLYEVFLNHLQEVSPLP